MKVGIFDSGIGGLSVLHEAYHLLDDVEYMFYADLDHVPYGLKTIEQIKEYSKKNVEFLLERGAKAIVVACNTATAAAIEDLRRDYKSVPILGMEPAVKPAVEETSDKRRIMVIATPVTIRENKLAHLLEKVDGDHRVDLMPMPGLVEFAENEEFESDRVYKYLEENFSKFDTDKYQALVLGCTHFNYFKPLYRQFFHKDLMIIDGNHGTIKHLAEICNLQIKEKANKDILFKDADDFIKYGNIEYFVSGRAINEKKPLNHVVRLLNRLEAVRGDI